MIALNRRGQSIRPIELLLLVGILFFGSLLLFLFASAENSAHEKSISILKSSVGGGRVLTDMLSYETGTGTIADKLVQNTPDITATVQQYFLQNEPQITRYKITRNQETIAETQFLPSDDAKITHTINGVLITLEYRK